jgi:cell division protein FtsB
MKWFAAALGIVVLLLQYRLWLSADGVRELSRLEQAVAAQRAENERLANRNAQLAAEVWDLKKGVVALEERARSELGMIAANETFYQVIPPHTEPTSIAPEGSRTAHTGETSRVPAQARSGQNTSPNHEGGGDSRTRTAAR